MYRVAIPDELFDDVDRAMLLMIPVFDFGIGFTQTYARARNHMVETVFRCAVRDAAACVFNFTVLDDSVMRMTALQLNEEIVQCGG